MGSLYDRLDSKLPRWMQIAPFAYVGKVMSGFAALLDGIAEGVYEGRLAALPGQVRLNGVPQLGDFDSCDALPLIGRDRGRRYGLAETAWDFAARCRAWMDDWAGAGTPLSILIECASVLGPNPPLLRIVTGGGDWWTLDSGAGTISQIRQGSGGFLYNLRTGVFSFELFTGHAWDWDSHTVPEDPDYSDAGDPSRWWLIVYAPCNTPYMLANDATFNDVGLVDDFWNSLLTNSTEPNASPEAGVVGLSCPRKWVDLLRAVVSDWGMAGCKCSHIIVSFDSTAFNPTSDSTPTSVPDGKWGQHTKYDSGTGARIPGRFPNADYIKIYAP